MSKNDINAIVEALVSILETFGECAFDLTGGDEPYLVAMGIVFERYREQHIQRHRFNVRNGEIIDCDQDGTSVFEDSAPELTIEELIRIYGGDVVYEGIKHCGTHRWELDDEFCSGVDDMWDICKKDVRSWNMQIQVLAAAGEIGKTYNGGLTVTADIPKLKAHMRGRYIEEGRICERLYDAGLLTDFICDDTTFSITYRDRQVKRCLEKAGQILEMKIYLTALRVDDMDGRDVYGDVLNGVCIDWDGNIHTDLNSCDTENEVDVIMIHGMVPVFDSCKNGAWRWTSCTS